MTGEHRLKILHIGKYFPPYPGGMETYLRDIMHALSRRGIVNHALVHRGELSFSSRDERLPGTGAETLRVVQAGLWARVFFTPLSPAFPLLLNRLLREEQPDLLHLHLPNVSAFWALLLPRARRLPWCVHWHSDVPVSEHQWSLRLFYRLYRPLERALLKRAQRIVVTSPPYLESSRPLREFKNKCRVVPLGIDPRYLGAIDTPPPLREHRGLRVLTLGRLSYYKGFDYLLRAAALVPELELDIVGSGDQRDSLHALARQLQLGPRVRFHGRLKTSRVKELLLASDCLCLPSIERSEAFGLVLLEAMYCGRATIASRLPGSGMSWVVEDGVSGELVEPASSESLARTFKQLLGEHAKLRDMGAAGRRRFDKMFHIDRSASELAAVLTDAVSAQQ